MSFRANIYDRDSDVEGSPSRGRFAFPSEAVPYCLATLDALVISLCSVIAGVGYHWAIDSTPPSVAICVGVGLFASFVHILRLGGGGYYDFQNSAKPHVELVEISISWITTALLLAFFAFLLKVGDSFSRGSFVLFIPLTLCGLLAARKVTKTIVRAALERNTIGRRNIVLIGDYSELAFLKAGDLLSLFGAAEVNRFALSNSDSVKSTRAGDARVLDRVANFVKYNNASEIFLAMPWDDETRLDFIRDKLKMLPVSARLLPDHRVRSLSNYSSSGGQNVLSIEIQGAPLSFTERAVKRLMDVTVAVCALVFFSPIMLLTAIAIKLDGPGPIIFRQNRKGFNGKEFVMFKFRTMTTQDNGAEIKQATKNDSRVTNIGRLLRASSIDELPQLVNVLRGEMAVVGPRPHALAHDTYFENIVGDYAFRHHVKPGITGWAQCNGSRGAMPSVDDVANRVKLDLYYINNWSLWLDIRILMKTVFEVLRKRNAY